MSNIRQTDLTSYADWINSQDWHFFCTFTTGYELTMKSARRLMDRTHDHWKKYLNECTLFWVAEPFEVRDGYHTHGILRVPPNLITTKGTLQSFHHKNLIDIYQQMCGALVTKNSKGKLTFDSWHRIELAKFDNRKNAGAYATKYITKSQYGKTDYDLLI